MFKSRNKLLIVFTILILVFSTGCGKDDVKISQNQSNTIKNSDTNLPNSSVFEKSNSSIPSCH